MKIMHQDKINIGIVCSPLVGGSGVVGSELAKYLAKSDKYKVVYIGNNLPFRLDKNDVIFHKVEAVEHALFTNPLREVGLVEGIVEAVIEHKLDIIHAHFAIPFGFCALQAREILKKMGIYIKVVTTLHGTDVLSIGREIPATFKYVIEQSNAITAVSVDLANHARKIYHTSKNIQVIYNFIDLNMPISKKANKSLRDMIAEPEEKIFVHVSNFRPIKRVADTIRVFERVSKKIPSRLLLVGKGPQTELAQNLVKSLNNKLISFVGNVKNPYQYLQISDGIIVTSEYESFCLVALESMAFGVPVFSTKVGGIPEVVVHGKSGYLSQKGNLKSMAKNIIKHFSNQTKIAKAKDEAYRIARNFAAEKIIPQYERIYSQLVLPKKSSLNPSYFR